MKKMRVLRKVLAFTFAVFYLGRTFWDDASVIRAFADETVIEEEVPGEEVTEPSEETNDEDPVILVEPTEEPEEGEIEEPGEGEIEEPGEGETEEPGEGEIEEPGEGEIEEPGEGDVTNNDPEEDVTNNDPEGDVTNNDPEEPAFDPSAPRKVEFFVLNRGGMEIINQEINSADDATDNKPVNYIRAVMPKLFYQTMESIVESCNGDMALIDGKVNKGRLKNVVIPEAYASSKSVSETVGTSFIYGEAGREWTIENDVIGSSSYQMATYFAECSNGGERTGNVVYADTNDIDWYVFKDVDDANGWHVDGFYKTAHVYLPDENKMAGVPAEYNYDGTSKLPAEVALINATAVAAGEAFPGNFIIQNVMYYNENGEEVSDIVAVGKYTAVVTAKYAFELNLGNFYLDFKYDSKPFAATFPITVKQQTNPGGGGGNDNPGGGDNGGDNNPGGGDNGGDNNPGGGDNGGDDTTTTTTTTTTVTVVVDEEPEDVVDIDDTITPLAGEIEEVVEEPIEVVEVTPVVEKMEIVEEDVPLASPDNGCWIHWLILILTFVDAVYTVVQAIRNGKKIKELTKNSDK